MATYKRQLKDEDGNTIIPDVGLNLDDVLYGTDPGTLETPTPWVTGDDLVYSSMFKTISWPTTQATITTSWTAVTVFASQTITGLVENATYLVMARCGLFFETNNFNTRDKEINFYTTTSGATITECGDYQIGSAAYSPRCIGTLTTGSNTSVNIIGKINAVNTGTYSVGATNVFLWRIA